MGRYLNSEAFFSWNKQLVMYNGKKRKARKPRRYARHSTWIDMASV